MLRFTTDEGFADALAACEDVQPGPEAGQIVSYVGTHRWWGRVLLVQAGALGFIVPITMPA
jgi:chromate transport protein ChrA